LQIPHVFSITDPLRASQKPICAGRGRGIRRGPDPETLEIVMTRDEFNRELRAHSASWQAVVVVYGLIVGTMVLSAMAIL